MNLDNAIHLFWDNVLDGEIRWRATSVPWVSYYYAEACLYVLRDMRNVSQSFAFVYANSPEEAVAHQLRNGGWKKTIKLVEKGGNDGC